MAVLAKDDLLRLIHSRPPLIEGFVDLVAQLQPNGFDLSFREVAAYSSSGTIGEDNGQRKLPDTVPMTFGENGMTYLSAGCYLITFNEVVNLPKNVMALGRPRSSLLRSGVTVESAVWDAGYSGRSQAMLVVHNSHGFSVQRNARLLQLVFFGLSQETEGYSGRYQGENIERG